ncbi:hypothetical protein ACIOWI_33000 [Streptomyces sp. NPDC087659]|uniref:hypothetical protein n=1 Tax=Streptomyces sp. NPDC087659 TaxID=3365801 RepID=UPI00380B4566
MPEDPIAQSEIAALTRRYEQQAGQANEALKVIKSDVLHLRLEVGSVGQRLDTVETRLGAVETQLSAMDEKMDRNQAQIVQLLTALVGKTPE